MFGQRFLTQIRISAKHSQTNVHKDNRMHRLSHNKFITSSTLSKDIHLLSSEPNIHHYPDMKYLCKRTLSVEFSM